ncbi:hypothetical protein ACSYDW_01420 [Paeniglutamicibacter sp. R2-26]|uniref:hypothetical protein n=1 Tax=Paeniglutamicibacter sp. R2-26 TaxID=3144417 RepID=UPI003EE5319B
MKYFKHPLVVTVIVAGAVIGAGSILFSDRYPGLWLGLIAAWFVVAGLSAYAIRKAVKEQ